MDRPVGTTPIHSWLCDACVCPHTWLAHADAATQKYTHARDACMQIQVLKKLTSEARKRKVVRKKKPHSEKKQNQNAETKNTKLERNLTTDMEQLMVSAYSNLLCFYAVGACCFAQIANSTCVRRAPSRTSEQSPQHRLSDCAWWWDLLSKFDVSGEWG